MSNPKSRGQQRDKPFRDALRMEIAAAGPNLKALRSVAASLLEKATGGDVQAIKEVADRLDGKPAQESTVTVQHRKAAEIPDDALADIALGGSEGAVETSSDPQILN